MSDRLTAEQLRQLRALDLKATITYWDAVEADARRRGKLEQAVRLLALSDLYYLLVRCCKRVDMLNGFAFARCREVEAEPNGRLDLWAREHFKSSIITFGLTIQDILREPEVTIGIFSHTRPIAKAFLRQIMRELEENKTLKAAFPDVLWEDARQAPKWSEDDGIIVRRKANPNEATVEAWGLVDGQPVSKHFRVLVYDDIVVQASVTTPEMIAKTMQRLEESYSLGTTPNGVRRFIGTRWHFQDAYATLKDRRTAIPREHPGRVGGTEDGESVYWPDQVHLDKRRDYGPYTYAAQILLNPKADALQGFRREWLCHYQKMKNVRRMNGYILVDAASSKKKHSDYTAMAVVGLNIDKKRYVLEMVRDRLNLKERGDRLFTLYRNWVDQGLKIQEVRYEKYGLMADIEHIRARMEDENFRFKIVEVGGVTSKQDRIKRLIPLFEKNEIWLPRTQYITNWEKTPVDMVRSFVEEEYMAFPVGAHEDVLDALARMEEPDLKLVWPREEKAVATTPAPNIGQPATSWLAA